MGTFEEMSPSRKLEAYAVLGMIQGVASSKTKVPGKVLREWGELYLKDAQEQLKLPGVSVNVPFSACDAKNAGLFNSTFEENKIFYFNSSKAIEILKILNMNEDGEGEKKAIEKIYALLRLVWQKASVRANNLRKKENAKKQEEAIVEKPTITPVALRPSSCTECHGKRAFQGYIHAKGCSLARNKYYRSQKKVVHQPAEVAKETVSTVVPTTSIQKPVVREIRSYNELKKETIIITTPKGARIEAPSVEVATEMLLKLGLCDKK